MNNRRNVLIIAAALARLMKSCPPKPPGAFEGPMNRLETITEVANATTHALKNDSHNA